MVLLYQWYIGMKARLNILNSYIPRVLDRQKITASNHLNLYSIYKFKNNNYLHENYLQKSLNNNILNRYTEYGQESKRTSSKTLEPFKISGFIVEFKYFPITETNFLNKK